jgi:uncharacterized protein YodC (DUF2158 family)
MSKDLPLLTPDAEDPDWLRQVAAHRRQSLAQRSGVMSAFKVGDVVELKSGGPKMTVARLDGDNKIWCNWFGDDGKLVGKTFFAETVKLVDPGYQQE